MNQIEQCGTFPRVLLVNRIVKRDETYKNSERRSPGVVRGIPRNAAFVLELFAHLNINNLEFWNVRWIRKYKSRKSWKCRYESLPRASLLLGRKGEWRPWKADFILSPSTVRFCSMFPRFRKLDSSLCNMRPVVGPLQWTNMGSRKTIKLMKLTFDDRRSYS